MPAGVPAAEPPELTLLAAPVELRSLRLWEGFYLLAVVATSIGVLLLDDSGLTRRLGAIGLMFAGLGWYWVFGHRLILRDHDLRLPDSLIAGTGILLCFGTAFALVPQSAWLTPAVVSQLFWLLPAGLAMPVVILVCFTPATLSLLTDGDFVGSLSTTIPAAVIFSTLAVAMGVFIKRLTEQKEEQAQLIAVLEASRARIAELSRQAGTAAERERLAREIHDTLAQGFTSIIALVQAVQSELDTDPVAVRRHLDLAASTARENLDEARAMVAALTPSALAVGTLADAVRRQCDRTAEESGLLVSCVAAADLPKLPTPVEVVVLRATQEALANARRHAHATTVLVDLSIVEGEVRLSVRDDGVGFEPDAVTSGFGLRGMRERARQVGGELTVRAAPGAGAELLLVVPA